MSYPVIAVSALALGARHPLEIALLPPILLAAWVLFGDLIKVDESGPWGFAIFIGSWKFLRTSLGQFCLRLVLLIVLLAIADIVLS